MDDHDDDLGNSSECGDNCKMIRQGSFLRSVKRKLDEFEETNKFVVEGLDIPSVARVEIGNECVALREMVSNQQLSIQDLSEELEEERNASSSAANEAMSMILRLQREKAEIQMELRQFKRFAEEKIAHDHQELLALEDLLYKREQSIQSLTFEMQAYKHRMMSYGLSEAEAERGMIRNDSTLSNLDGQFDFPPYDYPPLKVNMYENNQNYPEHENETFDIEKYAFGETPRSLKDIEERINQLEKSPRDKVIVDHSPKMTNHSKKFSMDSSSDSPKVECLEPEDMGDDRIYTIDSVHNTEPKASVGICDDFMTTPRDNLGDPEIQKLYTRLHALEADRESMRQAIISMSTDKAQLVLLKEIAQNICKEMGPAKRMPPKKPSTIGTFSFMSVFKWIVSFVFWRTKARRSRYMWGLASNNVGLLMLLDKGPRMGGQWRCISSTQV